MWVRVPLLPPMKLPDGLYRVVLSYACYGVEVKNERIIDTAPIASWAKGKSIHKFIDWIRSKKGIVKFIWRSK